MNNPNWYLKSRMASMNGRIPMSLAFWKFSTDRVLSVKASNTRVMVSHILPNTSVRMSLIPNRLVFHTVYRSPAIAMTGSTLARTVLSAVPSTVNIDTPPFARTPICMKELVKRNILPANFRTLPMTTRKAPRPATAITIPSASFG